MYNIAVKIMLRKLNDIKSDISEVITNMDVKDTRRYKLLDAIEEIDAMSEHFIDDGK